MDTTPEYIKMCEKAGKIQKAWEPKDGDRFFHRSETHLVANYQDGAVVDFTNSPIELKKSPHMPEYYDHAFREFSGGYEWEDDFVCYQKNAVWLPRQDQLQEIYVEWAGLKEVSNWAHSILDAFQFFALSDVPNVDLTFKMRSLEQLWLAFVMKEKYGKVWNGEEWREE